MLLPIFRHAALLALVSVLAACGSTGTSSGSSTDELNKLYADAKDDLSSGSFDRAIKTLEKIEARATGTLMGQQAMLDLGYAQWRSNERTSALATLDRFIKLHPSSPAFDYALYLRGLVNFNDNIGIFSALAGQSLSERDQKASRDAYQSFSQLVQQFPSSKYSADARLRMDYIVNSLAAHEVHVARYYLNRGAYLAAVNRARQAVVEFDRAPAVEEALAIMVEGYGRLGLTDLRQDAERILLKNFPTSRFVDGLAFSRGRPWWRFW